MGLEQGEDTPPLRATGVPCRGAWRALGRVGVRRWPVDTGGHLRGVWGSLGRLAGHIEQTVVAVLRLLHHAQQERFTVPCRLTLFPGFAFTLYGGLFAPLGGFKLLTQQITLQTQQVAFLLHGLERLYFRG